MPDWEGSVPSTNSGDTGDTNCTSLENSTMVPPITVNYLIDNPVINQGLSLNPQLAAWSISGRDRDQELSEEATSLMRREKTNKSYDSLFGRWHSWCRERQADPFSGPITNVVNFLASLHEKGYQYNSVNSYRSAIYMRKWKDTPLANNKAIERGFP